MGAGVQTLMNAIKQDNLISLKFIGANGLVDVYQHPDTKSYYAKVNEILLHNGYAEGNFKVSRLQKGKLRYPTVCVSKETNSVSNSRPTVYVELTQSSLNSLASVYPGVDLDHSLAIVPSKSSNNNIDNKVRYIVNNNTDNVNLKSIIKSFEEAVAELSIENNNLKNELEKERERYKSNIAKISNRVKYISINLARFDFDLKSAKNNILTDSETLYYDLSNLIAEESNDNNDEVDKENKILEGGENNGNQKE